MSRHPTIRLLPLAAAGLLACTTGAIATSARAQPQTAAQPRHEGSQSQQSLQNNSATRALDRAAGTNVSGAYPSQADGTTTNPPGTALGRAVDRAAGTDVSGAYPGHEAKTGNDGRNPPGTAAGRAMDRAADGKAGEPPRPVPTTPDARPDKRSDSGRLLLAQNALGTEPGVTDRGATLKGPEAQGGTGNNSGRIPGPRTGTAGNGASVPEGQGRHGAGAPGSTTGNTTEAPSLGTRQVTPPTSNPSLQDRPSSAR